MATPAWFHFALDYPVSTGTLEVDGCNISYCRWGQRRLPPVILVHGYSAHLHWWDHIAPFLTQNQCVWAIDLSGFGDSGRRDVYGTEVWGDDLAALIDFIYRESGPPTVVAHSLGGKAAVAAAAQSDVTWRGLILVDTALGLTQASDVVGTSDLDYVPAYPTAEQASGRFRLDPPQPDAHAYIVEHIAKQSIRQTSRGWEWKTDPRTRPYRVDPVARDAFSSVDCPVILLRSECGMLTDRDLTTIKTVFGRSISIADIPMAHHHSMVDQPFALVTALRTALAWLFPGAVQGSRRT